MEFAELAGIAGAHAEARAIQTALKLGILSCSRMRHSMAPRSRAR